MLGPINCFPIAATRVKLVIGNSKIINLGLTVDQYYFVRHNTDLEFPYLPCVGIMGGNNHISFFPLEILETIELIAEDAAIPVDQL
jgi:hypothetical protein